LFTAEDLFPEINCDALSLHLGAICLTTPMHLTAERLSVGNRRLPAAGDGQRCVAYVSDSQVL